MGHEAADEMMPTLLTRAAAQAWLDANVPTLIVVGSGISLGPPCDAPSVWPFLEATVPLLFQAVYGDRKCWSEADQAERDRLIADIVENVLPESCYGAIGQAFGTNRHLEMWGALGPATAAAVGAAPSPAHTLVVQLAATRGWPIVTTNFDCFLEAAAAERGYVVDRTIPRVSDGLRLRINPGAVSLLKLHGSALDERSSGGERVLRIRSTAADLSRCARIMAQTKFATEPRRALIIGYSGRDLDLFPWLASRFGGREGSTLWIEPQFGREGAGRAGHRALLLGSLVRATTANQWAMETLKTSEPPPTERPDRREEFDRRAREAVANSILPLLRGSRADAAAALVGVLCSIGRHEQAIALEEHLAEGSASWKANLFGQLWLSGAYCSLDRPDDAIAIARRGRRVAVRRGSIVGVARSWIAEAYAATVAQSLVVLPRRARPPLGGVLSAYLKVFVSTAGVAPIAAWAHLRTRRQDEVGAHRHALICDYLEHWIRLGALLDRLRGRLPGSRRAIGAMWRAIERACERVGYTVGVLEVGRYRDRVPGALATYDTALSRAALIGHPIGLAIAHRDRATAELKRRGQMGVIESHLTSALNFAEVAGSPSLKLKIKLEQVRAGLIERPTVNEVTGLLDHARGCYALDAQRCEVIDALTRW